jgi:hypothetical protein
VVRARDYIEVLKKDGWTVVCPPLVRGNFGDAGLVRGGIALDIGTNVVWDDERPTSASSLTLRPSYDPGRIVAPVIHAAHGAALRSHVAALASRTDLENMPKWWTLSLATVLAELSGQPPDAAVDELFRRCYVSWAPSLWRVAYLRVLPEARAEELALWLLSKERNATWLADIVPTDKVKKKAWRG